MEPLNDNVRWVVDHIIEAFIGLVALMGSSLLYIWNKTNAAHETALAEHKEASARALADHKAMNLQMHKDTKDELTLHREYFSKIFDKMEDTRKEMTDSLTQLSRDNASRHERLLDKLDSKEDKK